jgi:hypothetical protein
MNEDTRPTRVKLLAAFEGNPTTHYVADGRTRCGVAVGRQWTYLDGDRYAVTCPTCLAIIAASFEFATCPA